MRFTFELLYKKIMLQNYLYCAKQRLLLVPPKPKLFVKAASMLRSWAELAA